MNIVLCGMMGSGKTTVGKEIAKRTGMAWFDTDDVIVERHGNISDIFSAHGEAYFRDIETSVTKELALKEDIVLSTGGGLVQRKENVEALKSKGKIIFLCATIETLVARLSGDTQRPLLDCREGLPNRIAVLLAARMAIYEKAADYIVEVDGKTPEEIAEEIMDICGAKRVKEKRQ